MTGCADWEKGGLCPIRSVGWIRVAPRIKNERVHAPHKVINPFNTWNNPPLRGQPSVNNGLFICIRISRLCGNTSINSLRLHLVSFHVQDKCHFAYLTERVAVYFHHIHWPTLSDSTLSHLLGPTYWNSLYYHPPPNLPIADDGIPHIYQILCHHRRQLTLIRVRRQHKANEWPYSSPKNKYETHTIKNGDLFLLLLCV
jgi:hypothetical protein